MAENNQNRQPTAESHQSVEIETTTIYTRTRTHRQSAGQNRNYPLLQRSREIIERNYNGIKSYINRNYRRFSY